MQTLQTKTMKTNTKTYTLTVSQLASLQKDTKIYLDEAFQSNTRWNTAMNQAYIKSVLEGKAITPITLGKISDLLSSIELHYGPTHSDYQFFRDLLDQDFIYITIDGNNRDNCICKFLNNEFPLSEGKYYIEHNNIVYFEATKNNKYFKDLDPEVRNYIENISLNTLMVLQSDRKGLAELFSNINEGLPLNNQEKRNATPCRFGSLVRNLVQSHLNGFSMLYSSKNINRRYPDELVVTISTIVAHGIKNLDKNALDAAYGDSTVEVISFNKTATIVEQLSKIVVNYGAAGFDVGGKKNSNLIDFAMLLNYLNNNSIVIEDYEAFYNWFTESQGERIEDPGILYYGKKGNNPRSYAGLLRGSSSNFLQIRLGKLVDSISSTPDNILTFRDKDRKYDPKIRFSLWKSQGGRCVLTGEPIDARHIYDGSVTHIDHKDPWSKGGQTTVENAQLVFANANLRKGAQLVEVPSL